MVVAILYWAVVLGLSPLWFPLFVLMLSFEIATCFATRIAGHLDLNI